MQFPTTNRKRQQIFVFGPISQSEEFLNALKLFPNWAKGRPIIDNCLFYYSYRNLCTSSAGLDSE